MRLFDMDSKEDYLLDGKYKVCALLVDAVEVVRCKDCKHYSVEGETTQFGWCNALEMPTDE